MAIKSDKRMKMNFIVANFWCYSWTANVFNEHVSVCDKKKSWTNVQWMNQLSHSSSCKFLYVLVCFRFVSFQLEQQPATLQSWRSQRTNPTNRFNFIYISFWMIFFITTQDEYQVLKMKKKEKRKWTSAQMAWNGAFVHRFLNGS